MFNHLPNIYKVILLTVVYVVLILVSELLFRYSLTLSTWWELFGVSFLISFLTMAFGYFYFQIFKFHRIWKSYYAKKNFESLPLFRRLGVDYFRLFLIKSPFRYLNQRVYLKGRKGYYDKFIEETKQSETSHILSFSVALIIQFLYLDENRWDLFYWLLFFNILMNIYPILLQRYNRIRVVDKTTHDQ